MIIYPLMKEFEYKTRIIVKLFCAPSKDMIKMLKKYICDIDAIDVTYLGDAKEKFKTAIKYINYLDNSEKAKISQEELREKAEILYFNEKNVECVGKYNEKKDSEKILMPEDIIRAFLASNENLSIKKKADKDVLRTLYFVKNNDISHYKDLYDRIVISIRNYAPECFESLFSDMKWKYQIEKEKIKSEIKIIKKKIATRWKTKNSEFETKYGNINKDNFDANAMTKVKDEEEEKIRIIEILGISKEGKLGYNIVRVGIREFDKVGVMTDLCHSVYNRFMKYISTNVDTIIYFKDKFYNRHGNDEECKCMYEELNMVIKKIVVEEPRVFFMI